MNSARPADASVPLRERIARTVGVLAFAAATALTMWQLIASPSTSSAAPRELQLSWAPLGGRGDTLATRIAQQLAATAASAGGTAGANRAALVGVPSDAVRGVLGAMRDAGYPLAWRDLLGVGARAAISLSASREVAPQSGVQLRAALAFGAPAAAAPGASASGSASRDSGLSLVLRDGVGVLDSVRVAAGQSTIAIRSAHVQAPAAVQLIAAGRAIAQASVAVSEAPTLRAVRIYARPGWEAKFTAAALEELGWIVDGSLQVSPASRVKLGSGVSGDAELDTVRHAAAVVLDSGVVSARVLERFMQQGGGVVLAGTALRDAGLSAMQFARIVDERPAIAGALLTDQPRRGLSAFVLQPTHAVSALEREGDRTLVAAARVGRARVVMSGFRDTWRWRMEGRDDSGDAHRRWWNTMVSSVAFVSPLNAASSTKTVWPGDAAPLADLYARLGAPQSTEASPVATPPRFPPLWMLVLTGTVALLAEWASRRLRGAP